MLLFGGRLQKLKHEANIEYCLPGTDAPKSNQYDLN